MCAAMSQRVGDLDRRVRDLERRFRSGDVCIYPERVTTALDIMGLEGPEVDVACLAREPAVDDWEAGRSVPTWEQLTALAALTEFPVTFFFIEPTATPGDTFICGEGGCDVLPGRAAKNVAITAGMRSVDANVVVLFPAAEDRREPSP
jgi:hypothetical protein